MARGGLPVQSGEERREPATFHSKLDRKAVKDFAQVQQMIAANAQILDARRLAASREQLQSLAPESARDICPALPRFRFWS